MSLFSNPASNFATEQFVAEPDELEVVVLKPRVSVYKDDDNETVTFNYNFRVNSGEHKGKLLQQFTCWIARNGEVDAGAMQQMAKPIYAALGLTPGEPGVDDRFRAQFGEMDFGFDETDGTLNSGWEAIENQIIRVVVGKKWNNNKGKNFQQFKQFLPLNG